MFDVDVQRMFPWSLDIDRDDKDYRVHAWPLLEAVGQEDPLANFHQAMEDHVLYVEVVLIDRWTKRKALLYANQYSSQGEFVPGAPLADWFKDGKQHKLMLVKKDLPFLFEAHICLDNGQGPAQRLLIGLTVRTPFEVFADDFGSLFKSLEWV